MANELNSVGGGYAQGGVSQYSPNLPEKVEVAGSPQTSLPAARSTVQTEVRISVTTGSFSALSDSKDTAAEAAKSVRNADKALDKADALVTDLKKQVGLVKNYPPFPAGNEDRVKYLESIDGLRQELQSVVIPPVKGTNEPVFYPQQEKFPPLDPKLPSDAAVLAFGDAVAAVKDHLDAGRLALQAEAEKLSEKTSIRLPSPPAEPQAQSISARVGGQLAAIPQSVVGNSDVLAQL